MVVIPYLRHNKTEQVDIPKPVELYKRLGFGTAAGNYSGEETMSPNESKIDQVKKVAETAFEPATQEE